MVAGVRGTTSPGKGAGFRGKGLGFPLAGFRAGQALKTVAPAKALKNWSASCTSSGRMGSADARRQVRLDLLQAVLRFLGLGRVDLLCRVPGGVRHFQQIRVRLVAPWEV